MDVIFKTDNAVFNYRVAGIVLKDSHVLLHKLANDQVWSLPGGRVTMGEEAQQSLVREFREELDVEVRIDRLAWIAENFFEYAGQNIHEVGFYFLIHSEELSFEKESFFGVEGERLIFKWTPIEELKNVPLYPQFLRTSLREIPAYPEHKIVKQSK
jgi:ADP-ribose pyrophosphatase YjhB (NUDIX family)